MKSVKLSGTVRGRNRALNICYTDTCVLVDAFLEDPATLAPGKKRERVFDSRRFFQIYDGPELLTSPYVLAEFMKTATGPNFKKTPAEAKALVERIFRDECMELVVPLVDLHAPSAFDLPLLDYSMHLKGTSGSQEHPGEVGLIFRKGATVRYGNFGTKEPPTIEKSHERLQKAQGEPVWRTAALSSVLYNLFITAALDANDQGRNVKLQDAMVLFFARGQGYVDFITSDERLVTEAGPKPYPDVGVHHVSDYLRRQLKTATGSHRVQRTTP